MLARGTAMPARAAAEQSAVPAFATYNLEMVQAVVAAAEHTGRPVIMHAGSSHFHHAGRSALSIALRAAHASTATIGVHLDHCRNLAKIAATETVLPTVLPTHDSVALWGAGRKAVTNAAVRTIHTLASSQQGVATPSWLTGPAGRIITRRAPLKEERNQHA